MDRLIAINERAAVYVRDPNAPQKKTDPFRYINDLLSIRSAKGLVDFLDNYPNGLHTRRNSGPIEEELHAMQSPNGKFAFGETAMLNAAAKRNVEYFDALVLEELQGYTTTRDLEQLLKKDEDKFRDFYSQWTEEETRHYHSLLMNLPPTELSIVSISSLESLVEKIETTLLIAALSHFEIHGDLYTHFQLEKVLTMTRHVMVRIDREWLSTLLPFVSNAAGESEVKHLLESIKEDTSMHHVGVSQGKDGGAVVVVTPTQDLELGLRYAAGCVVAFLLSRWNHYFSSEEVFSYDIDHGYMFSTGYTDSIVLEWSNIIADHRFGVCPICERPFVVKRRPTNDVASKTYCTNSCKVKGNADGGWKDRPKKTLQIVMPEVDFEITPPVFVQVGKEEWEKSHSDGR